MVSQLLQYPPAATIATPCSALLPRHVWWAAGPFTISLLPFFQLISYTLSFPFLLYSCLSTNGKSTRFPLSKRPPCSHVCGIRDVGLFIHSYTDCSTGSFSVPLSRLCTCQDQPLLYQCSSVYTCGAIATWYSSPRVSSGRSIFSYSCAYRAKSYVTRNRPSSVLHYQIQKKLHLKNSSSISSLHHPYWASFHHSLALRLRHFYPHIIIQVLQLHPVIISLLMAWWSHLYQRHS